MSFDELVDFDYIDDFDELETFNDFDEFDLIQRSNTYKRVQWKPYSLIYLVKMKKYSSYVHV